MNLSKARPALAVLLSVSGIGCAEGKVSIGEQQAAAQPGLGAYVANWDGYIQAHSFIDGSDRVRLSLSEDGTGTIRFGNTELWPKPTDPNVKFPPSFPQCYPACEVVNMPEVWDGFEYTLNAMRGDGNRLRATAGAAEVFADWCKLQVPNFYPNAANRNAASYGCFECATPPGLPTLDPELSDSCTVLGPANCYPSPYDPDAGYVVTPLKVGLCEREILCGSSLNNTLGRIVSNVCQCDAHGCNIADIGQNVILDATLSSDKETISGTLVLTKNIFDSSKEETTNYTIVLRRQ